MKTAAKALFLSLSLGALTTGAFAQPEKKEGERPRERQPRDGQPRDGGEGERPRRGPGEGGGERRMGQQLSKEKLEAAWNAQATAAAKRLSLSSEQTTAVAKAYVESRETLRTKMEEIGRNRGEGTNPLEAMREVEASTREKFAKAVTDAKVSSENATKLSSSLGAAGMTGPAWDRMTDVILEMKLDTSKQQQAQNAIEDFVVAQQGVLAKMREDPQAAQETRREARENLSKALKGVLSEEQMKTFEERVPRGPAMRRPGGPGAGGGEGERPRRERAPEGDKPAGKPEGEKKPKKD
ncbi:MAG TPA: hypothetical protein VD997_00220 [Phycisphaerales bacterium]|nr:hypothetical protein [Phycisphaerales bacterium]